MGEEGGTMRQNGGRDHVIRGHKMAAATTCSVSRVSLSVKAHLSACESEQHTCYSMICYVHTAGLNAQFRYTTQIRFFVWLFTLLLKCGPSTDCCVNSSRSWNDPHAQLIIADITPIDHATMGFTEVTMATATSTAGLYGLMLKIRALKSHKTCISTSSHAHTPHMIFLTVKKKYNINISGAAIAMEMAGNKHVSHASEQTNTNNNTNDNLSNIRPFHPSPWESEWERSILGSNGGGLLHLGQPVWHRKVLRLRYCAWQSCAPGPHAWLY